MTPEMKARVFDIDIDTLTTLENVYYYIQLLTPNLEALLLSQKSERWNIETNIKQLKDVVSKGSESIRNIKID
jgi:hypothetical protein